MLGSEFGQTPPLSLWRLETGQLIVSSPGSSLNQTPSLIGPCSSTLSKMIEEPTSRLVVLSPSARS